MYYVKQKLMTLKHAVAPLLERGLRPGAEERNSVDGDTDRAGARNGR